MGFTDMKKVNDRANREAIWHVLRTYDVGVELLNEIKGMNINSLAYVRV